jgi:hypothetical protein
VREARERATLPVSLPTHRPPAALRTSCCPTDCPTTTSSSWESVTPTPRRTSERCSRRAVRETQWELSSHLVLPDRLPHDDEQQLGVRHPHAAAHERALLSARRACVTPPQ